MIKYIHKKSNKRKKKEKAPKILTAEGWRRAQLKKLQEK
jgi:hypothetical protein